MKISNLVKRTGVPKETIHFYIREGLLRKPRKSGINIADYNENHVKQIRFIKELRDNYYFPIPLIRKIIRKVKKQPSSDRVFFELHSKYFRPADRLLG
jgi:DNA-binding transcriptional MerR regulator